MIATVSTKGLKILQRLVEAIRQGKSIYNPSLLSPTIHYPSTSMSGAVKVMYSVSGYVNDATIWRVR
jgi:hypothetical protein